MIVHLQIIRARTAHVVNRVRMAPMHDILRPAVGKRRAFGTERFSSLHLPTSPLLFVFTTVPPLLPCPRLSFRRAPPPPPSPSPSPASALEERALRAEADLRTASADLAQSARAATADRDAAIAEADRLRRALADARAEAAAAAAAATTTPEGGNAAAARGRVATEARRDLPATVRPLGVARRADAADESPPGSSGGSGGVVGSRLGRGAAGSSGAAASDGDGASVRTSGGAGYGSRAAEDSAGVARTRPPRFEGSGSERAGAAPGGQSPFRRSDERPALAERRSPLEAAAVPAGLPTRRGCLFHIYPLPPLSLPQSIYLTISPLFACHIHS